MSMSQPVTTSERTSDRRNQLSLNGNKKAKPVVVVDVESNGQNKNETSQKSAQNGVEKKNGNEVIVLDEDDIPLSYHKKTPTKDEKPVQNNNDVVTASESRGSTPSKKRGRSKVDSPKPKIDEPEVLAAVFAEENLFDEEKKPKTTAQPPAQQTQPETKVLKLNNDILAAAKRRSDRIQQNASTIVNLSTVSVSEMTAKTDATNEMEVDISASYVPGRKVSGRKNTRPIKEIQFSYRTRNLDDSLNSSVDATRGSEINTSAYPATPGSFFERKRALSDENIESPKRARLDFSGLFYAMASPVTLLRNKFKRTKIQSSTPNKNDDIEPSLDESDVSIEEKEISEKKEDMEKEIEEKESSEVPAEKNEEAENANEKESEQVAEPVPKKRCSIM